MNLTEMTASLKKPLPTEAIKPHPSKPFLSTINPMYVIERLNEVFGLDGWAFTSEVIKEEGKWVVVKGKLTLHVGDLKNHTIEQYGGNDNPDLGDAYKGAATDALTKCASYLGIGAEVWKSKKAEEPKQDEDNRPWLTEQLLAKAKERILGGDSEVYEKTIKSYRIMKSYRDELNKLVS